MADIEQRVQRCFDETRGAFRMGLTATAFVRVLLHREDIDGYKGFFTVDNTGSLAQQEAALKVAFTKFTHELEKAIKAARSTVAKVEKGTPQTWRVELVVKEVYYQVQVFKAYAMKTVDLWPHASIDRPSAYGRILEVHNLAEVLLEDIANIAEFRDRHEQQHPARLKAAIRRLIQEEFKSTDAVSLTDEEVMACKERIKAVPHRTDIPIIGPTSASAETPNAWTCCCWREKGT